MGKERFELSRVSPPHFECGASTISPLAQRQPILPDRRPKTQLLRVEIGAVQPRLAVQ